MRLDKDFGTQHRCGTPPGFTSSVPVDDEVQLGFLVDDLQHVETGGDVLGSSEQKHFCCNESQAQG